MVTINSYYVLVLLVNIVLKMSYICKAQVKNEPTLELYMNRILVCMIVVPNFLCNSDYCSHTIGYNQYCIT